MPLGESKSQTFRSRRREFENSFRIRVTSPTRTHLSRIGMSMCISLSHRARTVFEFVSHHPHGHFPGNHSLYSHNSNTQILSRRREFENSFRIRVTSPTRTHLSRIGMSMCISLSHRARTVFEFVSHHPHGHFPGNHSSSILAQL